MIRVLLLYLLLWAAPDQSIQVINCDLVDLDVEVTALDYEPSTDTWKTVKVIGFIEQSESIWDKPSYRTFITDKHGRQYELVSRMLRFTL